MTIEQFQYKYGIYQLEMMVWRAITEASTHGHPSQETNKRLNEILGDLASVLREAKP